MNDSIIISIVMPAYGVEAYIAKAIESVMAQDFQDWELLVVNDGSKDRSREIAKAYEDKDPRIKVLDKENGGLSDARNFGLQYVKGKYVHFFDSDDFIDSDFYSTLVKKMEETNNDFVVTGYKVDFMSGQKVQTRIMPCFESGLPLEDTLDPGWVIGFYFNFAWNKIYRTSFLSDNNLHFAKGVYGYEDAEFMSHVVVASPSFRFVQYAGYHYIQRDRETLSTKFDDGIIDRSYQNLLCFKKNYLYFTKDSMLIDKGFQMEVLSAYKHMFNLLFQHTEKMTYSQYRHQVKLMLKNQRMQELLLHCESKNHKDKLLYHFIKLRFAFGIILLYKAK